MVDHPHFSRTLFNTFECNKFRPQLTIFWLRLEIESTLDYLINVMYGIGKMALSKDYYHLVILPIGMYFLIGEKVGKILQKQISEQRVY